MHTWSNQPGVVHDPAASPGNPFASEGHSPVARATGGMPTPSAPSQLILHNPADGPTQSFGLASDRPDISGAVLDALVAPDPEMQHHAGGANSTVLEEPRALPSLAASVANHAPLHVQPTSTQEGTETPVVPSDDDTIEMRAGGAGQRGAGRSRRGRRTGSSGGGGTAAAALRADAAVAQPADAGLPPPVAATAAAQRVSPAAPPTARRSCSAGASPSKQHPQPPGVTRLRVRPSGALLPAPVPSMTC